MSADAAKVGAGRRRWWAAPVIGSLLVLVTPGQALADPPRPTDYRTEVLRLDPAVPGVVAGIVGGDSFVSLDVERGTVVEVVGYQGEPYLRIEADGVVRQNERSPTRWLNDDRYGTSPVPVEADPAAEPRWVTVGEGGHHLWHDHRAHWMNDRRPPGVDPGGIVLESVVPLVVDGVPVELHVRSVLLAPPDLRPVAAVAALLGAGVVVAVLRPRLLVPVVLVAAAAATLVGVWAYTSVPRATGPSPVPAVVASLALVAAGGAAAVAWRNGPRDPRVRVLLGFAAFELALWSWLQREALVRASLPTSAPHWLDRGVVAGAGIVGVIAFLSVVAPTPRRP